MKPIRADTHRMNNKIILECLRIYLCRRRDLLRERPVCGGANTPGGHRHIQADQARHHQRHHRPPRAEESAADQRRPLEGADEDQRGPLEVTADQRAFNFFLGVSLPP